MPFRRNLICNRVQYDNSDILTLPTTSLALAPVPGPGHMIIPWQVVLITKFAAGAYGNKGADASLWSILGTTHAWSNYIANIPAPASPTKVEFNFFFSAQNLVYQLLPWIDTTDPNVGWGSLAGPTSIGYSDNEGMYLKCDNGSLGNLTGGHVDNLLYAEAWYTIAELP